MGLKKKILYFLLKPLFDKKCPPTLPFIDEKREKRDCYYIFLLRDGKRYTVAESIDSNYLYGKQYEGNEYIKEVQFSLDAISYDDIEIVHNYLSSRTSYKGLLDFIIINKSGFTYIRIYSHILSYNLSKFFYNRKRLVTVQRLELLKVLVTEYINNNENRLTSIDIMTKIYSIKWVEHPDSYSQENKLGFYLDSLVLSGELNKDGAYYFVTPKSILTLEKYEEDDSRYRSQVRLQIMMVIITLLLAIVGMIQTEIIKIPTILDLTKYF
jgi:hypothetical protein